MKKKIDGNSVAFGLSLGVAAVLFVGAAGSDKTSRGRLNPGDDPNQGPIKVEIVKQPVRVEGTTAGPQKWEYRVDDTSPATEGHIKYYFEDKDAPGYDLSHKGWELVPVLGLASKPSNIRFLWRKPVQN